MPGTPWSCFKHLSGILSGTEVGSLLGGLKDSHFVVLVLSSGASVQIQRRASSLRENSRAANLAFPGCATPPSRAAKVRGGCPSGFEGPPPPQLPWPRRGRRETEEREEKGANPPWRVEEGLGPPSLQPMGHIQHARPCRP